MHKVLTSWVYFMWHTIARYCDWVEQRAVSPAADVFLILVLPVMLLGAIRLFLPGLFFVSALLFLLPIFYVVANSVYHATRNH